MGPAGGSLRCLLEAGQICPLNEVRSDATVQHRGAGRLRRLCSSRPGSAFPVSKLQPVCAALTLQRLLAQWDKQRSMQQGYLTRLCRQGSPGLPLMHSSPEQSEPFRSLLAAAHPCACAAAPVKAAQDGSLRPAAAGMTELSPVGTWANLKYGMNEWTEQRQEAQRAKQGWPGVLTDLRIVGDKGRALPHDGVAFGELQAKGPHTVSAYHKVSLQAESCMVQG